MIDVSIARSYKALACAIIREFQHDLQGEIRKRDRCLKRLAEETPGTQKYFHTKGAVTTYNNRIKWLQSWEQTDIAQFYFDFASLELPGKYKTGKGEQHV